MLKRWVLLAAICAPLVSMAEEGGFPLMHAGTDINSTES
jgi:hypothetical protein